MKAADEVSQLLDDHIVMTQAMSFSPFKKPFENRIMTWESKLRMTQVRTASLGLSWKHYQFLQRFSVQWTYYFYHWYAKSKPLQDVMEEWVVCQRAWLYLEPIFNSEDIMKQMPVEGRKFNKVCQEDIITSSTVIPPCRLTGSGGTSWPRRCRTPGCCRPPANRTCW